MPRTPLLAAAAAVVALALPAGALAQSAGDDQYHDPLAGSNHSSHHSSHPAGSGNTAGTTASSPTTATSAHATGTQKQLPRTGFDVILPIELGIALTLTGLTLQRVLTLQSRRR